MVGAGTAGANTAYQLARRGRRVLLVERRPLARAGAHWRNGLLDRHFHEAGLTPPSGPERGAAVGTVHLRARDPRVGVDVDDPPTVSTDMALLGGRLRNLATEAGVEVIDRVRRFDVDTDATDRVRALTLRPDGAGPVTVEASLFVDASGYRGSLRRQVAALVPWCPTLRGDELCSASDFHREIDDPAGAEGFLERHGALPGDSVTFVGIRGGFSTCAVTVDRDLSRVGILVGCLANGRCGTGPRMVADLRRREPWIGAAIAGGSGIIPLRRPYARITAPGVALVGDSACQVFPAHGSGVGAGLIAGSLLAEGMADVDDLGDPDELWRRYQHPYQRSRGRDLAAFDVLRRATTRLGGEGVDRMVRSGLIDEHTTRTGLDQRWAPPPPAQGIRSAARFVRWPDLARVMVPALARAQAVRSHVGRHPAELDLAALDEWERRTVALVGPLPS